MLDTVPPSPGTHTPDQKTAVSIFAYLVAVSPLLALLVGDPIGRSIWPTLLGIILWSAILYGLAYFDFRALVTANLADRREKLPIFVLISPLLYFVKRSRKVRNFGFIWIWLATWMAIFALAASVHDSETAALFMQPSASAPAKVRDVGPKVEESKAPPATLSSGALNEIAQQIAKCWTVPAAKQTVKVRFDISETGEVGGKIQVLRGDRRPEALDSAMTAIQRCAPYRWASDGSVDGEAEIDVTFSRTQKKVTATNSVKNPGGSLVAAGDEQPEADDDGAPSSGRIVTNAFTLVLEVEQNGAAALQSRSSSQLYRLTPDRTSIVDGYVVLEQDIGMHNVAYATIYCFFNTTDVDARDILVGVPRVYSAVLYDFNLTQRYASSGRASGVINFKEVTLSECEVTSL